MKSNFFLALASIVIIFPSVVLAEAGPVAASAQQNFQNTSAHAKNIQNVAGNQTQTAETTPLMPKSWTGFYFGVNAGYHHDTNTQSYTGDSFVTGTLVPHRLAPAADFSAVGGLVGLDGGYDYQIQHYLLGVQGNWEFITGDGPNSIVINPSNNLNREISKGNINWMAMLKAKLGVTTQNFLFYIVAGPTLGQVNVSNVLTSAFEFPTPIHLYGKRNVVLLGAGIGGGVEMRLSNVWSAKAEYFYYDLGNTTITQRDQSTNATGIIAEDKVTFRGQLITLALIYRFLSC